MEYKIDNYRRMSGHILTTADGHKYLRRKYAVNSVYLKCALFRDGCKATAKLDKDTDLITPGNVHNHDFTKYHSETYNLKKRCKIMARTSQEPLRKIFDDAAREDSFATEVSFPQCESSMYRSRRRLEPKIPSNATELSLLLPTTTFGKFHKSTVSVNDQTALIFFSDKMRELIPQIPDIQFDGTFYCVPKQFYQLWTIFVTVERHTLPAIHCLLTGKEEGLYRCIMESIRNLIPQFNPMSCMSDWEIAPRNVMKDFHPDINIKGCWFHFTQRIWHQTQKLGLVNSFHSNQELSIFVKHLMAIPFLPSTLIRPTYSLLDSPTTLTDTDMINLDKLKRYFAKRWLCQVSTEELSVFDTKSTTNNGAESYHAKLKTRVQTGHPRIWNFLAVLNEIIVDADLEFARLSSGKEFSRPRKRKNVINDERRSAFKNQLVNGNFTPWEYLEAISGTIGKKVNHFVYKEDFNYTDNSQDFDDTENLQVEDNSESTSHNCVICLNPRTSTWIFLPCKHANCCGECSDKIEELGKTCPTCRSPIVDSFQIYN